MKLQSLFPFSGLFGGKNLHKRLLIFSLCLVAIACGIKPTAEKVSWNEAQHQEDSWYGSQEAQRIADNVLLYQNHNGGWVKNIDMAAELSESDKKDLAKEKSNQIGTTIDNGATHTQMRYLAKVFDETKNDKYKEAFLDGLDYLLEAQYENGGWPQFYPIREGYYEHITYNDGAMIGVMQLLKDVAKKKPPYDFVGENKRQAAQKAIDKGLEIILETQVEVDGELTVWCAQHDKDDLSPAKARAYELPSLSGSESVGIVQYLMELEQPDERVITAVESAVDWFESSKVEGIRLEKVNDENSPKGYDLVVVEDPEAKPIWGRFYELETQRPIFVGRDGIIKYHLSEIEQERRIGYSFLGNYAGKLLGKDYPEWKAKIIQ
ncbi:pectate lyase [Echinicola jeungdonensis]|uniref:Pectate lyase n=1 Tax=Echinicola jeungdonensis TaxID=709343 RepID=A0ABV5J3S5_9BACT|nr:pectate lyase [Echinicola jeungdonensis]MDN3669343.1 pectate lyase [Echinicola jeungdonensis]